MSPRRPQPPPPEFFVDRSLGRYTVPEAIREAGFVVHTLASVYGEQRGQDIADVEWLERAGAEGWVSYDPYGKQLTSTGTSTHPFKYAGQYTDASGLQYLRARYYDPATAQNPLDAQTREARLCQRVSGQRGRLGPIQRGTQSRSTFLATRTSSPTSSSIRTCRLPPARRWMAAWRRRLRRR